MRTLALLAALLLLALQVQAEILQETGEQVPVQDMPEAEDQDQPMDKVQDMAISFAGVNRLTRGASGLRGVIACTCRKGSSCLANERPYGTCTLGGKRYILCCR